MLGAPTHLFTSTLEVLRSKSKRDASGSPVSTFAPHLTGIPCRTSSLSASESRRYGSLSSRVSLAVYVESRWDIKQTDRIVIGQRTFTVAGVVPFGALDGGLSRLDCLEVVHGE